MKNLNTTGNKKPFSGAQSTNGILNNLNPDYNKIPTQKEIIDSYCAANKFFREASNRKNKEATWYFNEMRVMESKAHLALDWRDNFDIQESEYLGLMLIARGAKDV